MAETCSQTNPFLPRGLQEASSSNRFHWRYDRSSRSLWNCVKLWALPVGGFILITIATITLYTWTWLFLQTMQIWNISNRHKYFYTLPKLCNTLHYTIHTVHYTTIHTVHYKLNTVHYTLYTVTTVQVHKQLSWTASRDKRQLSRTLQVSTSLLFNYLMTFNCLITF